MKKSIKKGLIITFSVVAILVTILAIDIYLATNPKIDETTVAMGRIDLKQDIQADDAATITKWLYQQPGVSRVVCNPDADNVVFTFYPIKVDATALAEKMSNSLNYNAVRYIADAAAMQKGCPVSPNSLTYRIYTYFK